MADHEPLDCRLGDLPLPAGLQERMSLEALFDDTAIDRLLRGVPVPDGLGERVLAGRGQSRRSSRSVDLERLGRAEGPAPTTAAAGGRTRDRTWLVAVNAGLLASALAVLILAGTAARTSSTLSRAASDRRTRRCGDQRIASNEAVRHESGGASTAGPAAG